MVAPVVAMVAPKQGRESATNLVSTVGPSLGAHDRPRYGGETPIQALWGRPPSGAGAAAEHTIGKWYPKFAGLCRSLKCPESGLPAAGPGPYTVKCINMPGPTSPGLSVSLPGRSTSQQCSGRIYILYCYYFILTSLWGWYAVSGCSCI